MSLPSTRRRILQTSLAAAVVGGWRELGSQSPAPPSGWLLLGNNTGQGVYRARWNAATGEVGTAELAVATPQPTFLTMHPRLSVLYACNESDAPAAAVSAFEVDRRQARLAGLQNRPTGGGAPCFASVDRTGSLLFTANYGGGSLTVFPLDRQGIPGPATTVFNCAGTDACGSGGPVKDRQSSPHLHCAVPSPENRFVLACDLGDDAILAFPFQPHTRGALGTPTRIRTSPGAGPRHLAFHPNGRWFYCVNEIDCTVCLYRWRPRGGQAAAEAVPEATVSILPPSAPKDPPSTGAEIAVSHDGRFLYTSTRFCDALTVFAVEPEGGRLTQIQQLPCGGKTPRFFALDPSEQWLVCANQDSDDLSVFAREVNTGRLAPRGTYPAVNPECVLWL